MSGRIWVQGLLQKKLSPLIIKLLQQAGILAANNCLQLYLVGGLVRDLLLDSSLQYDYDLVVTGDAGQFAALLQTQVGGRLTLYPRYLTATITLDADTKFDLVTARKEIYSKPAALPYVEASDLKDDLYRRDFSVNALASSLLPGEWGLLYDYYHGYDDLQNKLIRVFHPNSFIDDPLRIIRAIRFEQRYAFTIEKQTLSYLIGAIRAKNLALVDQQRLAREVKNIYLEPQPKIVLERLQELGVGILR